MKHITEFLNEAMDHHLGWSTFTTDDMIDHGVWTPNDDLTYDECMNIVRSFNKKYNGNSWNEGKVAGVIVQCKCVEDNVVEFDCDFENVNINTRIAVVQEIVNLLTNTIYSVVGDKHDIRRMLDHI